MSDCAFIHPVIQEADSIGLLALTNACPSPKGARSPFVAMIRGSRGLAGCNGRAGADGANGANGIGTPGNPGAPGKPGRRGMDGCSAGNGICSQAIFR